LRIDRANREACMGACENSAKAQSDGGGGLKKCLLLDEFDERN